SSDAKKTTTVFVAGSTGRTGKRVVEKLLERGFGVVAGTTDVGRARRSLPQDPNLQLVRADVMEGTDKLVDAIRGADAVVCATGFRRSFDPFAPWKVDNFGTVNLVEACRKAGVTRFILVSSILVNGAAMGQLLNPAYTVLNLFGLVLVAKLQAEKHIRSSGINYTIIRPGGLTEQPPTGNIVMEPEDTLYEGSISRQQVAEVAVEALLCREESSYKVVEIVTRAEAHNRPLKDLFASIKQS
ncbi:Os06g0360300, partial [Oryza sativa Japonica Group]